MRIRAKKERKKSRKKERKENVKITRNKDK